MQKIMKIIPTKSSGYSYESPRRELSDEYPFAKVSVIFKVFKNLFVLVKLATSSIRVNVHYLMLIILQLINMQICDCTERMNGLKMLNINGEIVTHISYSQLK